jgi:hypothetical protein
MCSKFMAGICHIWQLKRNSPTKIVRLRYAVRLVAPILGCFSRRPRITRIPRAGRQGNCITILQCYRQPKRV